MHSSIVSDIITYRVGWACEDEENEAYVLGTVKNFVADILLNLSGVELDNYECHLSGNSEDNFRHQYAVTKPYKGNRKDSRKPKYYDAIRSCLVETFGATVSDGEEADDTIAIRATELGEDTAIICSIDKDFDQVVGWHYNFVKNNLYHISPEQARLNFYKQFLVGDTIDNIEGVRGIGDVKATKLLDGKDEDEMFETCVRELGSRERAVENGILLYLRRKPNEVWSPPNA